jgi:hypothetical protein
VPSGDVVEFGGWPRPPRWVWAVAGVAAVAVLAGVVVARAGPHHAAAASRAPAASPVPRPRTPANGSAAPKPVADTAAGVVAVAYYPPAGRRRTVELLDSNTGAVLRRLGEGSPLGAAGQVLLVGLHGAAGRRPTAPAPWKAST